MNTTEIIDAYPYLEPADIQQILKYLILVYNGWELVYREEWQPT